MEWSPTWSPDGSFIAFARNSPGNANVFIMPVKGGEAIQLTHTDADKVLLRKTCSKQAPCFMVFTKALFMGLCQQETFLRTVQE